MAAPEPTDEQLVSLSKDGSLEAFNTLVHRHETHVFNLSLRLLGDRGAAEDVTQEAFFAAYRALASFRGGTFRSWLLRIAANACRDELRRRRRRPLPPPSHEAGGFELEIEDREPGPAAALEHRALAEAIQEALGSLGFDQRRAVVLVDYLGLDYPEAVAATGWPPGTLRSRLHRGRESLRRYVLERPELFGEWLRLDKG